MNRFAAVAACDVATANSQSGPHSGLSYPVDTGSPMANFKLVLTLPAFRYVRATQTSAELGSQLIRPIGY